MLMFMLEIDTYDDDAHTPYGTLWLARMSMPRMFTDDWTSWKAAVEAKGGETIGRKPPFGSAMIVIDDPALLAKGTDPQLNRAIAEIRTMLEKNPPKRPSKPPYTDRTR